MKARFVTLALARIVAVIALSGCYRAVGYSPPDAIADAASAADIAPMLSDAPSDRDIADVSVDAGPRGALFSLCTSDGQCPIGGACLRPFPGGLCTQRCDTDANCGAAGFCVDHLCLRRCAPGGLECNAIGGACASFDPADVARRICIPNCFAPGTEPSGFPRCAPPLLCDSRSLACSPTASTGRESGAECSTDADCRSGRCVTEVDPRTGQPTGFVGGYCVSLGRRPADSAYVRGGPVPASNCPPGTGAADMAEREGSVSPCFVTCRTMGECRGGYRCETFRGMFSEGMCIPINCRDLFAACPPGYHCEGASSDGRCARNP